MSLASPCGSRAPPFIRRPAEFIKRPLPFASQSPTNSPPWTCPVVRHTRTCISQSIIRPVIRRLRTRPVLIRPSVNSLTRPHISDLSSRQVIQNRPNTAVKPRISPDLATQAESSFRLRIRLCYRTIATVKITSWSISNRQKQMCAIRRTPKHRRKVRIRRRMRTWRCRSWPPTESRDVLASRVSIVKAWRAIQSK